ncbi:MAG: hypothetical protein GF350_14725, partial [Chitinivibrionales bacterium]|nr:hypothetical protein [Chitinivibrionales bacterium]
MFWNRYIFFLTACGLCAGFGMPRHAVAAAYSIESFAPDHIEIGYSHFLAGAPPDSLFAFGILLPPDRTPAVTVHSRYPATGGSPEIVSSKQGYCGTDFYHWIVFSPYGPQKNHAVYPDTIRGIIDIRFSSPAYAAEPKPRIRNSILHASPLHGAAKKKATVSLPDIPFSKGIRISVDEDGIYEITGAQLRAAGVPLDRVSSRYLRLFKRETEVPIFITNSHRDRLKPEDKILFYGKRLRGTKSYYTQYSNTNAYWLTWENSRAGLRIAEASVTPRIDETAWMPGDTGELAAKEFRDTLHLEEDTDIRWLGDINAPLDIAQDPSESEFIDNWYWSGIGGREISQLTVDIPSPSTRGRTRMRFSFMGITSIDEDPLDHRITILINGESPNATKNTARWDGQTAYIHETGLFSTPALTHGANTLTFITEPRSYEDRVSLNWIEIEYDRTFTALDNHILFKNNPSDIREFKQFSVTGFTVKELDLWDIGNSRLLTGFSVQKEFVEGNTSYSLVFQDSLPATTRFLAQAGSQRKQPLSLVLDTIRQDWSFPGGIDYLMITTRKLQSSLDPLASFHTMRGLRAEIVTIEDIYNRFSWGIRNPESIRTLIAYLFSIAGNNAPRYLLLGGDT